MRIDAQIKKLTLKLLKRPLQAQVRLKGRIVNLTGVERTEAERHAEDNQFLLLVLRLLVFL